MFRVRDSNGQSYALKRMFVNDPQKLNHCREEIEIMVSRSEIHVYDI